MREHLFSVWDQSGVQPKQLAELPPLPGLLAHLWAYFIELHERRSRDANGPLRISWLEFEAWGRVTGRRLDRWERNAIFKIDDAWFEYFRKSKDKPGNQEPTDQEE